MSRGASEDTAGGWGGHEGASEVTVRWHSGHNNEQWLVVAETGQAGQWHPHPGDRRGRIPQGKLCPGCGADGGKPGLG